VSLRFLTVVGARPQFVKAAPVSLALRTRHEEVLVHTGQHFDDAMSGVFFRELGIPEPDVHLGAGAGPAGPRMAAMVRGIAAEIRSRRPDAVIVYGDTDSTQAGALAAREEGARLVHVEAGLRSGDLRMPEEVNRIVADHVADLLLAPTAQSAERLARERVRGRVEVVGDVMLDACLAELPAARKLAVSARYGVDAGAYYAATVHRAGNTDDASRLASIVAALADLPLPVLMPCHPRTLAALRRAGLDSPRAGLRLLPPLGHAEMLCLVAESRALLTDSGGLQKEAWFAGVPCVTLRDETEWTETLAGGWNRLAGTSAARIREAVLGLGTPSAARDLESFGGGRAAGRVLRALESAFG
jgi:UDP-N-acetylglucosamine 2-epimerase